MRLTIFILLLALSFGCKKALTPEQQAIQTARSAFEEDASQINAQKIIKAVEAFVDTNGYNNPESADYVLEAAELASVHGSPSQTRLWFRRYLVEYPNQGNRADLMAQYITASEQLRQPKINDVLYKSFVNQFPDDERANAYAGKITEKDIQVDSLVRHLGLTMFNDSTFRLDVLKATVYVDLCQDLVMANPNLPDAPEYLHHAAETARTLRDVNKALTLYDWIIDQYPTSDRAATSLFLKAFTLDNDLKQFDVAEGYYHDFLERHPDSEFAESAQFLLDNLGKSEEELKKMLKENAEQNVQ